MTFDKDFTEKCKEHFGKPPIHIKYLLTDIVDKVEQIEKRLNEAMPVMGATIIKMEVMSDTLCDKGILNKDAVRLEVENMIAEKTGSNNKEII